MTKEQRKTFMKQIVKRNTVKAVDVSAFSEAPETPDSDEFAISIETVEVEETDMGNFISKELATVAGEKVAKVREVDYSNLDAALSEPISA